MKQALSDKGYSAFQLMRKYARYWLYASNGKGHGIHSPFVFSFIKKVLNNKTAYPEYKKVEELRKSLWRNTQTIEVRDLGAGPASGTLRKRTISSIARKAAKPPKYAQLIFRIARYFKPAHTIEAGTSMGLTTLYLALANPQSSITTLEGAPEIADQARKNFEHLGIRHIKMMVGHFDETLPAALDQATAVGLVFIDGNHRQAPTEAYFAEVLKHAHNDTVIIFDDIHWSAGMEKAWEHIKHHEAVTTTIDLFFIGIVFLRKEIREKQHFTIRF